jgi:hypothetical protein
MPNLRSLLVLALLSTAAAAQTEWVANGDFTGTVAPWVLGGAYSVNPGHEVGWDTTGMGASDSFGVNAGGQVTPSPYPPNWIEQQVVLVQGLTYEFRADASGARPGGINTANADIGTIRVEVDSVEIARLAFGSYTPTEIKRAQITGRFTATTTGTSTLRINFERRFLAGAANPRMNLDNVSLKDVYGPTYGIEGNRRIGTTLTHRVLGNPTDFYAAFVAAFDNPGGISFPGVNGTYWLELATTVTLNFGSLDGTGLGSFTVAIANDPVFLSFPLSYQAVGIGSTIDFGQPFRVVCTQ